MLTFLPKSALVFFGQMSKEKELEIDEISFEDIPASEERTPLSYLPLELQEQASRLEKGKEYTILELDEEGAGHNDSLLRVASICFRMGVEYEDALAHLQDIYSQDRIDYETAPARAIERVWSVEGDIAKLVDSDGVDKLTLQEEMLLRFRRTANNIVLETSPSKVSTKAVDILKGLFEKGDIINCQHSALEYATLTKLSDLDSFLAKKGKPLEHFHFFNPSTFKKVEGTANPLNNDKVSTRCNANVKLRKYMVLEFDYKETDPNGFKNAERFNTFAMTMANFAPLVMAVDTGGKSVHYWYEVGETAKSIKDRFFQIACLHGADSRLGVKSQIARLPNTPASKEGRGKQSVIYLDLDRVQTPKEWDLVGFEDCLKRNKHLDFYYNPQDSKAYLCRSDDDEEKWVMKSKDSFKILLGVNGMRLTADKDLGEIVSPADAFINEVEQTRCVEACLGGAAGYHSGIYEEGNQRLLVLKSPILIKAKKGQFPTIGKFLEGMLGHEEGQLHAFFGWLRGRVVCAYNEGKRVADVKAPSQMLHFAGDANAGKTLLTEHVISPMLGGGGEVGKADPLFKKFASEQNKEMFSTPLLVLDDSDVIENNFEFRRGFAEKIKNLVVGRKEGYRAMRQDRINLTPFWSLVRCMNLEPHTISTIPPLESGFEDKIIILHGQSMKSGPLGAEMVGAWFDRFAAKIKAELPAFIHWLLEEYEQPEEFKDPQGRFDVVSFKSKFILEMINEGSPEQYLMGRIDGDCTEALFGGLFDEEEPTDKQPWSGSVDDLYDLLANVGMRTQQQRFSKVCPNSKVLISQLRALEKKTPERIVYSQRQEDMPKKKKGVAYWIINPKTSKPPALEASDLL